MVTNRSLTADFDAIQEIVARRGLDSTVRLLAQVAAANGRYYQAVASSTKDECRASAWFSAQVLLSECAVDIGQESRL